MTKPKNTENKQLAAMNRFNKNVLNLVSREPTLTVMDIVKVLSDVANKLEYDARIVAQNAHDNVLYNIPTNKVVKAMKK